MFPAHSHTIRYATGTDAESLRRLAELDSQQPIVPPALIGEVGDRPIAALSLSDGRAIADPFERTAALVTMLRLRAASIQAAERTPSLRERMLDALPARWTPARRAA